MRDENLGLEDNEFRIPIHNVAWLTKKIANLNKKALKLNAPLVEMDFIKIESKMGKEKLHTGEFRDIEYLWHIYRIEGQAPVLNGWELNAVLEHFHTPTGDETLVHMVPGKEIPTKYRHVRNTLCEHCHKNIRSRIKTYVVRNVEFGDFKTVGSGCLRDFLGHADPESFAWYAEWRTKLKKEIHNMDEDFFYGLKGTYDSIGINTWMQFVCESVLRHGFISKKKVDEHYSYGDAGTLIATSWNADENYWRPDKKNNTDSYGDYYWTPSEESKAKADAIIAWANEYFDAMDTNLSSEYDHNLKVILNAGYVNGKNMALFASLPSYYWREVELPLEKAKEKKERDEDDRPSNHVGNIKDRMEFTAKVIFTKEISRPSYSYYDQGVSYLYKLIDLSGNHLTWFASGSDMEVGNTYKLLGTIKKHDEYNGVKQTILTRCKVKEEVV